MFENKSQMEKVTGPPNGPPPSYQEKPFTLQPPVANRETHSASQALQEPQARTFHFPQSFSIYHASSTDLVFAQSKEDTRPTHYVSTHGGFSSQPSVVLHSGPRESSSPLATASFHPFSSTADIRLYLPSPPPNNRVQAYTLQKESSFPFSSSFTFRAFVPSTNALETFSWKKSTGPEVRHLEGSSHGKICVRASTGEVVAAWALPSGMSMSKKGKIAFLGDRGKLGEWFEVMSLICILAIMEKARRQKRRGGAAGGGAGMGGSAGGGGGGGGC